MTPSSMRKNFAICDDATTEKIIELASKHRPVFARASSSSSHGCKYLIDNGRTPAQGNNDSDSILAGRV